MLEQLDLDLQSAQNIYSTIEIKKGLLYFYNNLSRNEFNISTQRIVESNIL
jgi:hypothetical protein